MKPLYDKALTLHQSIDDAVTNHYASKKKKAPCAKGCASCCSQFFEVSELEFLIIFEHLNTLSESEQKQIAEDAETIVHAFKEYWPAFYTEYFSGSLSETVSEDYYSHAERFEINLPCLFLSKEGSCTIYERRPFTCRTTGVGYQHLFNTGAVCAYIRHGLLTPLWQADLRQYREPIDEIRWLPLDDGSESYKRQYPLFFYVYKLYSENLKDHFTARLKRYR